LFGPLLFDAYRQFKPEPAAGFALEVCRIPGPGMATCLGGGYIASGAVGPEKQPRPYLPEGLALLPQEMAGEVQTPLRGATEALRPGDPVFFRHAKAGELSEHFLEFIVLSGQNIAGRWLTYRGEAQCFLG
jgi:D-serine deaminase-like pyridoxal phosphate-dependent protein